MVLLIRITLKILIFLAKIYKFSIITILLRWGVFVRTLGKWLQLLYGLYWNMMQYMCAVALILSFLFCWYQVAVYWMNESRTAGETNKINCVTQWQMFQFNIQVHICLLWPQMNVDVPMKSQNNMINGRIFRTILKEM